MMNCDPTDEMKETPLVRRITDLWPRATEEQRLKITQLCAFIAEQAYPSLARGQHEDIGKDKCF